MNENMSKEQLEARVGMAAEGILNAIENGEDVEHARKVHAEALAAYNQR